MYALLKSLRSAIGGLFFLLCGGLILLWPVTKNYNFELFNNVAEFELYCMESWDGKLRISHSINCGKSSKLNVWRFWSISDEKMHSDYAQYSLEWSSSLFGVTWNKDEVSFSFPHIVWAALALMLAYLVKPTPKLRFAFQDLLIMTAMIAAIVGGFTLTTRSLTKAG